MTAALEKRLIALEATARASYGVLMLRYDYEFIDGKKKPVGELHDIQGKVYTDKELALYDTVIIMHRDTES